VIGEPRGDYSTHRESSVLTGEGADKRTLKQTFREQRKERVPRVPLSGVQFSARGAI